MKLQFIENFLIRNYSDFFVGQIGGMQLDDGDFAIADEAAFAIKILMTSPFVDTYQGEHTKGALKSEIIAEQINIYDEIIRRVIRGDYGQHIKGMALQNALEFQQYIKRYILSRQQIKHVDVKSFFAKLNSQYEIMYSQLVSSWLEPLERYHLIGSQLLQFQGGRDTRKRCSLCNDIITRNTIKTIIKLSYNDDKEIITLCERCDYGHKGRIRDSSKIYEVLRIAAEEETKAISVLTTPGIDPDYKARISANLPALQQRSKDLYMDYIRHISPIIPYYFFNKVTREFAVINENNKYIYDILLKTRRRARDKGHSRRVLKHWTSIMYLISQIPYHITPDFNLREILQSFVFRIGLSDQIRVGDKTIAVIEDITSKVGPEPDQKMLQARTDEYNMYIASLYPDAAALPRGQFRGGPSISDAAGAAAAAAARHEYLRAGGGGGGGTSDSDY